MNYIKEAENYLYYYADMHRSLERMEHEICKLVSQAGPRGIKSAVLDETGIKAGHQDETMNILFRLQILTENKEETKRELEKIDKILDEISRDPGCELYGLVLRKWYIEQRPKEEIAAEIGYSSRQSIYSLQAKAIRKFAVQFFGIRMVEDL
ncbi:hypothetical protein [Calorimonas adulescens]|uniref:DUF1492 domain-containing protein n=1 Tax=Calorimonas adulescens TaxID=2606906 RepID=A0A5D8QBT5_9THEO|nr:hypothetical protein [Calorimonas adulescens]TZE81991.1 hypothetical protein FWJ32_07080 [Calorimonas adulescens]